ncbi:uncharacterized protein [Spinacia oleracea]|uniref:Reverse transcriptase domain-containing protein n=1 Tax=Spinacia oleracea TaxID=3562 RepID=A0ABM3QRN5_SPIOL|nr:uncharacterized protein LOC130461806 [Spinacia oleracea]
MLWTVLNLVSFPRGISDNILLAIELIKGYNRKNLSPWCMIKVDLKKAYDSIEWSFLRSMLFAFGFPPLFISWIMECVSTVSYSILINGSSCPPFSAKRSLIQGDPLSPFLFALLLLFCGADPISVNLMYSTFLKFSRSSVLEANRRIYIRGVSDEVNTSIKHVLRLDEGTLPLKYLGVPLASKPLTFSQCKPLIEKMVARVRSWSARMLCYAGKMQLVKIDKLWIHGCIPTILKANTSGLCLFLVAFLGYSKKFLNAEVASRATKCSYSTGINWGQLLQTLKVNRVSLPSDQQVLAAAKAC